LHDLNGAVDALPDHALEPRPAESMATTGTDGQHIENRFALPLPYGGDGSGRDESATVGHDDLNTPTTPVISMSRNPLVLSGVDASGRVVSPLSVSAGGGIRTHMRVTPRRILSPRRLPFRHAGREATTSWSAKGRSSSMAQTALGKVEDLDDRSRRGLGSARARRSA
jgi:hypothetical protein